VRWKTYGHRGATVIIHGLRHRHLESKLGRLRRSPLPGGVCGSTESALGDGGSRVRISRLLNCLLRFIRLNVRLRRPRGEEGCLVRFTFCPTRIPPTVTDLLGHANSGSEVVGRRIAQDNRKREDSVTVCFWYEFQRPRVAAGKQSDAGCSVFQGAAAKNYGTQGSERVQLAKHDASPFLGR